MNKKFTIKDLDINAIVSAKTKMVRIDDVDIKIKRGRIDGITFFVRVNVHNIPEDSALYYKQTPRYQILFFAIGKGAIKCQMPDFLPLPMSERMTTEMAALEEFCVLLRNILGIDRVDTEYEIRDMNLLLDDMVREARRMNESIEDLTDKIERQSE